MRSRVPVYFGSLLATIALINTPVPRVIVSAVLNPEAGDAVARSLASVTKDLVLVLLISIYFEWARTREHRDLLLDMNRKLDSIRHDTSSVTASATRRLVLESTSPEELVTTALERHVPGGGDKSSLASVVLSSRPAYHDVSVTIRAERIDGQTVHISSRYEMTMPRGPLLIAVTSSPTHTTALSDACPELFDASTLAGSTSFEKDAKEFGEKLECYVETGGGVTRPVAFRRVPAPAVRKYISPPVRLKNSDIVLFHADLSHEDTEFVRVRQHAHWSQDLEVPGAWWYADRPMFARTITFDMRELVRVCRKKVWIQVFIGSVDTLILDDNEGYLALRLDKWIVQGQGVIANW
ncbi:hypothetical protein SAMN05216553_106334 [Lentzea fradiae]|uniref:Uncharacterized protein n=1 Tax=Lentzea fradiae TaxID=200378 RepID=A0A1G7SM12_9PSEU|nr:hypothetical protein [Lentzea fradiae]SDG23952.1 hypothetical protein SAMN05216553_106334 [Lentzea fradiae]